MAVVYSITAINARLNGLVTAIGAGGFLKLIAGSTIVSTITLANPCGTVSGGVLTFTGATDLSATGTGNADHAIITDAGGTLMISGLTVGNLASTANIIVNNGLNSTFINAGDIVQFISGQITGS